MMLRYDLSLRHKVPVPQQLPEDLTEKLSHLPAEVPALRRAHDYQVAQMGNADETPICLGGALEGDCGQPGGKACLGQGGRN